MNYNVGSQMRVLNASSYKMFLKSYISEAKRSGLMTEMAEAAGCDRTYLSQVLSGKAHLTSDHAVNLAEFLGLNEDEENYFLLLVLHDRASNIKARKRLKTKMRAITEKTAAVTKNIYTKEKPGELNEDLKSKYYSHWAYGAIHILSSIREFQKIPRMASALRMSEEEVEAFIKDLVEMKLITKSGENYFHQGGNLHVPADSPMNRVNHLNWRMKAMDSHPSSGSLHYSVAFSLDAKDVTNLKLHLLEFIEEQRKTVHASGSEVAIAFCCDLFPLTNLDAQ